MRHIVSVINIYTNKSMTCSKSQSKVVAVELISKVQLTQVVRISNITNFINECIKCPVVGLYNLTDYH